MVIYTLSLYHLFDETVQLYSVQFKTTQCQIYGLVGLVASAEIHFTNYLFREMLTTLKITRESSYMATNVLANVSCPANLCE